MQSTSPALSLSQSSRASGGWQSQRRSSCTGATCPVCRKSLVLHQPDQNQPSRLLGTCTRCQVWVLIDVDERGVMTLIRLPDAPG